MQPQSSTKTCSLCKTVLPRFDFYAKITRCKTCHKRLVTERRREKAASDPEWRRARSAKVSAKIVAKYATDPEFRARVLIASHARWEAMSSDERRAAHHHSRFGGLRESVILRDGERCLSCGMTREAHREQYGFDLNVHHKDGVGRRRSDAHNLPENLITLCHSCHGKISGKSRHK
jgi:5-methylcytosine-specific restriction endonuclease McrA